MVGNRGMITYRRIKEELRDFEGVEGDGLFRLESPCRLVRGCLKSVQFETQLPDQACKVRRRLLPLLAAWVVVLGQSSSPKRSWTDYST